MNDKIKHETEYIQFLEKRLASENYKKNVSEEEYEKTSLKLERAKTRLKYLKRVLG